MQDSSELPAHAKDKEAGTLNMSHSAFDMGRSLGRLQLPAEPFVDSYLEPRATPKAECREWFPACVLTGQACHRIKTCHQEQIYPSNYVSSLLLSCDVALSFRVEPMC